MITIKTFFATIIFLLICNLSFSQFALYVVPNDNNKFVEESNINWAVEAKECYSFINSNTVDNKNIYDYLFSLAESNKSLLYRATDWDFNNDLTYYQLENTSYNEKLAKLSNEDIFNDSLKNIRLHEIFFLDNYSLKCQIIATSPQTSFALSNGIGLGLRGKFYCSFLNKYPFENNKNDTIIYLKTFDRTLNFDSTEDFSFFRTIKQTYGMSPIQALWYGASIGKTKLLDIVKNEIIDSDVVLKYTYKDSLKEKRWDTSGNLIGYYLEYGYPIYMNLKNYIQFKEDVFYNKTNNFFFTKINECYLFVGEWDDKESKSVYIKRFKILFN